MAARLGDPEGGKMRLGDPEGGKIQLFAEVLVFNRYTQRQKFEFAPSTVSVMSYCTVSVKSIDIYLNFNTYA